MDSRPAQPLRHRAAPAGVPEADAPRGPFRCWTRSWAVPLCLAVLLIVLTEQTVVRGPLLMVDPWVRDRVQAWAAADPLPGVELAAEAWTRLGTWQLAFPMLALVAACEALRARRAGWSRWWIPLAVAMAAVVLLVGTVVPAKIVIAFPGPQGEVVAPGGRGWYPSGHTSTASVCFGTAALLLARGGWPLAWRRWLFGAVAVLCLGVGVCMVWRDYHWVLDVVAGWTLSGLLLWGIRRWAPRNARGGTTASGP